jgi:2-amino-4-hydroxy-6-hydroxymethyldihydropteridine diphosphokinase
VRNIRRALNALAKAGIKTRRRSSLYETEPVDFRAQPWFVNCVVEVQTELTPPKLLATLKSVERDLGRRPTGIPKGPRLIDIDILLYDNVAVRSRALTIPHERLAERRFVLVPLAELAPRLRHPASRRTVRDMLRDARDANQVIRLRSGRKSKFEAEL